MQSLPTSCDVNVEASAWSWLKLFYDKWQIIIKERNRWTCDFPLMWTNISWSDLLFFGFLILLVSGTCPIVEWSHLILGQFAPLRLYWAWKMVSDIRSAVVDVLVLLIAQCTHHNTKKSWALIPHRMPDVFPTHKRKEVLLLVFLGPWSFSKCR